MPPLVGHECGLVHGRRRKRYSVQELPPSGHPYRQYHHGGDQVAAVHLVPGLFLCVPGKTWHLLESFGTSSTAGGSPPGLGVNYHTGCLVDSNGTQQPENRSQRRLSRLQVQHKCAKLYLGAFSFRFNRRFHLAGIPWPDQCSMLR